jgi:hypothetical protein
MEEYLEQVCQRHNDPILETEARKILEGIKQKVNNVISAFQLQKMLIVIEGHRKEFPHNKRTISANQMSPWLVTGYRPSQMTNIQAVGGDIYPFSVYDWNENGWQGPSDVVANQQGQQVV